MAAIVFHDARRALRKERFFRDRTNPLENLMDKELIERYRLPRTAIMTIVGKLDTYLIHPTQRSCSLPVVIQVLAALRLFAKGSFLSETVDIHGISKTSASVCITSVTAAIVQSKLGNITFPTDPRSVLDLKAGFYKIAKFPNVIGAVDGSLIPIRAPSTDEPAYVCRKGFHAINIQAIVDHKLRFINVVSRWPGSVHDSFVWNNCAIAAKLETTDSDGWLLGDSGYALRPWLMTPLMNPTTRAERAYNRSHKVTRCIVERAFGVMKSRFRCLHKSGGCLQFDPAKCCQVALAICHLHNICIDLNLPLPDDFEEEEEDEEFAIINTEEIHGDGKATQTRLIQTRFN